MKLLLKIKYDGGAYHGFQYQPNAPTIQGILTERISEAFGFPCTVTGCSRTDAGVHALGYCAAASPADEAKRLERWCTIPTERIHRALNVALPDDIAVVGACEVPDEFHPRYDTVSKEYIYLINDGVCPDPFQRGRAYHAKKRLTDADIEKMNEAASFIVGRHDFSSFMAQGSSVSDTVRTLFELTVKRIGDATVQITARGDGFLYNMVRILTGTLLEVASDKISVRDITDIVDSCDRSRAGFTAPACGLYLNHVEYGDYIEFKAV